jgi:thioredoxin reductase (NADPH)
VRSYGAGEALARVGEVGAGLTIILAGKVDITQHHESGRRDLIVTHGPGEFMGELAQLAGRPVLVDANALEPVEALTIAPDRLRALLVAEAELGERIMRALILRRIGLIETGAGPVIVGRAENGDVLRLRGFLRRNGHPHQQLDPETDPEAKALIERFHVDPGQLPIVLCPGGQLLRNPGENELARCGRSIPSASTTWWSWGPGRPASPPRSMPARKVSPFWCWTAAHSAARPAPRPGSRTTWAFRPGSPGSP